MEKIILGISGKKQSGKSTLANYIFSYCSECYFSKNISPIIYNFADALKNNICRDILGLSYEQCYGTDEERNSLTEYVWEKLPEDIRYDNVIKKNAFVLDNIKKKGKITARELLQIVGTNIFRNYFNQNVWIDIILRKIKNNEKNNFFIIPDVRFYEEINCILENKGYVIRLTRVIDEKDSHLSEVELDNYNFILTRNCFVINNKNMLIYKKNEEAIKIINKILIEKNIYCQ